MSSDWVNVQCPGWTPLSDDNLRGWVMTEDEADNVRRLYEANQGMAFVGARRGGSKFGSALKSFEIEGYTKARVRFSDINHADGDVVINDGVPFHITSVYNLSCIFGRDKHKAVRERHRETLGESGPSRKRKAPAAIKMGCPATLKMKEVIRFPGYKVSTDSRHQKVTASDNVRKALNNHTPIVAEHRIYIRLPSVEDHIHELGTLPKVRRGSQKPKKIPPTDVTLETIKEGVERLEGHLHLTPVMTSGLLDKMAGCNLHFKCELLQKTGSFKIRGALNAVSKLLEELPDSVDTKVITHSSGNFGQALAYAAQIKGLECYVVMPRNAPQCKINAVLGYGASVVMCDPTEKARAEACEVLVKESGAHYFSSNQSFDVISGHGSMGLELLDQIADLDAIVVPVGGGGMISGIAVAVKSKNPSIKVYAAEPCNADDCYKSFHLDKLIPLPEGPVDTVADGLRVSIGENTLPIIAAYVEDVITVTEEEIKNGTRIVWQYLKQFIEPSAGVGMAAVLSQKFSKLGHKNVAVILCGGNVDMNAVKLWM